MKLKVTVRHRNKEWLICLDNVNLTSYDQGGKHPFVCRIEKTRREARRIAQVLREYIEA